MGRVRRRPAPDFRNTGRIRDLVRKLLREVVLEGDVAAIRTTGPSRVLTTFQKSTALLTCVDKLSGAGLRANDIITVPPNPQIADEVRYRARVSLSGATAAVALLGDAEPVRRALLYISNGYPLDISTSVESRALSERASANGVRIFATDAASLDRSASAADTLGPRWDAQSGGFAILDADDANVALQQVSTINRQ